MHIAIEGLDGVGKTTTAKRLAEALNGVYVSKAFHLMHDKSGKYDNFTLLSEFYPLNMNVDSSYGVRSSFLYAKANGLNVVTERYFCTNYAVKPNEFTLNEINLAISNFGMPSITFILYCDYETNYKRMYNRNPNDKDFDKLKHHKEFYENMERCADYIGLKKCFIDTTLMNLDDVIEYLLKKINTYSIQVETQIPLGKIDNHELLITEDINPNLIMKPDYSVKDIYFSSNVHLIPPTLFSYFPNLERITVSKENPNFSSDNGILFDKNKTVLIKVPSKYLAMHYTVPESIITIGYNAFQDCQIENIILNDFCEEIGYFSFLNCNKLQSIKFGERLSKIGKNAFVGCSSVNFVDTFNSKFSFYDGVLLHPDGSLIATFNNKVHKINCKKVAAWAFVGNTLINEIVCGDTITRIGPYSFAHSSLVTITINSFVEICDYAFWNCKNLKSIIFNVKSAPRVAHELFYGIKHKIDIIVPNGQVQLFEEAFKNCSQRVRVSELRGV